MLDAVFARFSWYRVFMALAWNDCIGWLGKLIHLNLIIRMGRFNRLSRFNGFG